MEVDEATSMATSNEVNGSKSIPWKLQKLPWKLIYFCEVSEINFHGSVFLLPWK